MLLFHHDDPVLARAVAHEHRELTHKGPAMAAALDAVVELAGMAPADRAAMGQRARTVIRSMFSKQVLCTRMGDLVEAILCGRPPGHGVGLCTRRQL